MTPESQTPSRRLRVAVLMGGTSNERDVSLVTGAMIREALDPKKYLVSAWDARDMQALAGGASAPALALESGKEAAPLANPPDALLATDANAFLADSEGEEGKPDVVFIALHGRGGEDGTIQGALELMGVPYTGSGVLASALAMDKRMAKRLFRSEGLPVIPDMIVERRDALSAEALLLKAMRVFGEVPLFVKPSSEGSTFGCSLVTERSALPEAVALALQYDSCVLVERYIKGKEITVGVLEDRDAPEGLLALPVIEIIPKNAYYDYESKYATGGSEHIIPARISPEQTACAQTIAKQCHALLGCRGMSRADFIATEDAVFLLEVNTIPGMTPTSLLPQAAEHAGISFSELLDRIIGSALAP